MSLEERGRHTGARDGAAGLEGRSHVPRAVWATRSGVGREGSLGRACQHLGLRPVASRTKCINFCCWEARCDPCCKSTGHKHRTSPRGQSPPCRRGRQLHAPHWNPCPLPPKDMLASFGQRGVLRAHLEQKPRSASVAAQGEGRPNLAAWAGCRALRFPHVCKPWHCTWEACGKYSVIMMIMSILPNS